MFVFFIPLGQTFAQVIAQIIALDYCANMGVYESRLFRKLDSSIFLRGII